MDDLSRGRIAGIDFGTVRIGVALTDIAQSLASPYETYQRRDEQQDARYFLNLAKEERLVRFVVGLPVHMSGDESKKSLEARQFGDWLGRVTSVEVVFFDERFTSAEAEDRLRAANLSKKQRKERIDMVAAQILLTNYLASSPDSDQTPPAIED